MKLPKSSISVTPFSKALAMGLFVVLPFIGFWLGMEYHSINVTSVNSPKQNTKINNNTSNSLQITPFSPTPTSSYSNMQKFSDLIWNTHNNAEMGVRFEYPTNLNHQGLAEIDALTVEKEKVALNSGMAYIFQINKIVTNDSVEEWWDKNDSSKHNGNGLMPTHITKTSFHNRLAYYFETIETQQVPSDYYIIPYSGYFIQISFSKVTPYRWGLYSLIATNTCQSSTLFGQIDYDDYYRQFDDLIVQRILSSITFEK